MNKPHPPTQAFLNKLSRALAATCCVAGLLVMAGWALDIGALKSIVPGWTSMKFNTAACFALAGVAILWMQTGDRTGPSSLPARIGGALISLIALVTLFEYAFDVKFGIDELLFRDTLAINSSPGRMSSATAANFLLLGLAIFGFTWKTRKGDRPAQTFAVLAAFVGLLGFIGYLYDIHSLYAFAPFSSMALHTAILFMAAAVALLTIQIDRGPLKVLVSSGVGGITARRLLPFAILVPVIFGWIKLMGERSGWYTSGFGVALMATSTVLALTALIWTTAQSLDKADSLRKKAEAREAWLATFPQRNPMPIVEVDLQKNTLEFVNNAAHQMFPGLTEQGLQHPWLVALPDAIHELETQKQAALVRNVQIDSRHFSQHFHYLHDLRRVRVYGSDVTALVHAEQELLRLNAELADRVHARTAEVLLAKDELEVKNVVLARTVVALNQSNEELKQFAYIASHDLQTPLRNISGFLELLQSSYADKLDPQAHDWIRRTVQASQHMHSLIRDVLAFSRIDTAIEFESVPFQGVFDDALAQLETAIRESGGKVTCGETPTIIGNRSLLVQLLQNLIGNGLKYRGKQPPVVHVSAKREADGWVFSVRDNGIGIDPKYHERIFEIFRRLHNQREYSGTGIGLAICRRVIQRHGGKLWVESQVGEGSDFQFTIPDRGGKNEQPSS